MPNDTPEACLNNFGLEPEIKGKKSCKQLCASVNSRCIDSISSSNTSSSLSSFMSFSSFTKSCTPLLGTAALTVDTDDSDLCRLRTPTCFAPPSPQQNESAPPKMELNTHSWSPVSFPQPLLCELVLASLWPLVVH